MRNLSNGRKYFGAKYGRTKDLTGKELSVSFTDIHPWSFPGVRKTEQKVRVFGFSTAKHFIMGTLTSKLPLNIAVAP